VEAGGRLPPAQLGRDGDAALQDDLLRQVEGVGVAEASYRVAVEVRDDEPDDGLGDAAQLRRMSHQRSGRSLLTLIYATTPGVLKMMQVCKWTSTALSPEVTGIDQVTVYYEAADSKHRIVFCKIRLIYSIR
jgi:hypothetical protein